jgi:hypothetical protein
MKKGKFLISVWDVNCCHTVATIKRVSNHPKQAYYKNVEESL